MLGELLGQASGTVSGMRVLSANGDESRIEVSFQGTGELCGVGITDRGTFVQMMRRGGALLAETASVLMLTERGEIVSFNGFGVGRPTGPGLASSWGASGFIQTSSEQLAALLSVATVAEYDLRDDGGYRWTLWEWKGAAD